MIKARQIQGNGIYVLEGVCCANTHFVENKKEVKIFLNLVSKRLGQYMKILEYVITPSGWQLIVKTKSEKQIMKNYLNKIRGDQPKRVLDSPSKVISEAVRILRSRFTNITNPLRGREGNASKRVYQKYLFCTFSEAKEYIKKVRNQQIDLDQSNIKYRTVDSHYDNSGELADNSEILSSKTFHENYTKNTKAFLQCLGKYEILGKQFKQLIEATVIKHCTLLKRSIVILKT